MICEISPTASVKVIRIVLMICNLILSIQVENRNGMVMRRFILKVLCVRGQEREREKRRERERERESKRAREQESKRAREQESKRAREQESKRAREQESKRAREQESKKARERLELRIP